MKIKPTEPPRQFMVGPRRDIELTDCAHIALEADQQVTFTNPDGAEYDVLRKEWGFYATPSLNGRLPQFKLHACLMKSPHPAPESRYFVLLVDERKREAFEAYVEKEQVTIVCWLDNDETLEAIEERFGVAAE